uniref:SWIM-type domain-containing protein n=1 Tax=Caenorhabditis tropicalis TaxID=1561998 RepID=A0A1I7UZE0_9PELO
MEMRKKRTPSARMLASKQDEVYDKVPGPSPKPSAVMSTLAAQLARASGSSASANATSTQQLNQIVQQLTRNHESQLPSTAPSQAPPPPEAPPSLTPLDKVVVVLDQQEQQQQQMVEEEIDVSNTVELDMSTVVQDHLSSAHLEVTDSQMDDMQLKQEKMDAQMVMNADFSVSNEVVISSMKYQGRPPQRKMHYHADDGTPTSRSQGRSGNYPGETLNLKSSDLSIPNKAAHFLYFRCYEEHEVQKEFPLTIDENRKGPQNFLVEPRHGLKNTDYYIDSYLWNRGKSTSSKKKIFVEIEGNHVKTSRRSCETAHYVLNWYYSNMENRICKKVCWLETIAGCSRASPVLVQYHVNYLSDNPIELRKTPKLYSDTRSVAQELLRSDSPLQTVQRFVETGETDPREIINKKQAYEMRRYVMANARKRTLAAARKYDDGGMYFDDDVFEEIYYNEHGEPIPVRSNNSSAGGGGHHRDNHMDLNRVAQMAVRIEGRKIEHRIARMLDSRLGPGKAQAEMVSEWINSLEAVSSEDYDLVIHNVVGSMRKHLDELLGEDPHSIHHHHHPSSDEYHLVDTTPSTSDGRIKRMKMMRHVEEEEEEDEEMVVTQEEVDPDDSKHRFEGERYIFDGQEYVEEEVITDEIEEEVVVPTSSDVVVDSSTVDEVVVEEVEEVEGVVDEDDEDGRGGAGSFFYRPSQNGGAGGEGGGASTGGSGGGSGQASNVTSSSVVSMIFFVVLFLAFFEKATVSPIFEEKATVIPYLLRKLQYPP